jgi:hypothetical protein
MLPSICLLEEHWMVGVDDCGEIDVMNEWKGKSKYSQEICFSAALSTRDPTWLNSGLNPAHRVRKLATNRWATARSGWYFDKPIKIFPKFSLNAKFHNHVIKGHGLNHHQSLRNPFLISITHSFKICLILFHHSHRSLPWSILSSAVPIKM